MTGVYDRDDCCLSSFIITLLRLARWWVRYRLELLAGVLRESVGNRLFCSVFAWKSEFSEQITHESQMLAIKYQVTFWDATTESWKSRILKHNNKDSFCCRERQPVHYPVCAYMQSHIHSISFACLTHKQRSQR